MPIFTGLKTEAGMKELNNYLLTLSFIEGYEASQSDVKVFDEIDAEAIKEYENALRWYNHIAHWTEEERKNLPGDAVNVTILEPEEEEEDDIDLFGDDDEDDEAAKALAAKKKADMEKKKKAAESKSTLVLDVKPWDDETDMKKLEEEVRAIEMDGLMWGKSQLTDIGYGIKKLQIGCIIVDALVATDDLDDRICEISDYVQSMDIASFQKV